MGSDNSECVEQDSEKISDDIKHPKRRLLAQLLAGSANSILLVGISAAITISSSVIAGLSSGNDPIVATQYELSWLGSIGFFSYAAASPISGLLTEPLGRKKAMLIVNLLNILAWTLLWQAPNMSALYGAHALLGIGAGLMEAPLLAYMGEICEPSIRGVLLSYSSVFTALGLIISFLLGAVLPWRLCGAAFLSVPSLTIVMMSMVPESPSWLLAKGHNGDALKSLCWLRGWVKPSEVGVEFKALLQYHKKSASCFDCDSEIMASLMDTTREKCTHNNDNYWKKVSTTFRLLKEKETYRPLILASMFFMFTSMTSIVAVRPNLINVFKAFKISMKAEWALVGVGVTVLAGYLGAMSLIKITGKRPLALAGMTVSIISTLLLGTYAYFYIPHNLTTYTPLKVSEDTSAIPLVLFVSLMFSNAIGIFSVSWMILSEIFPYKTRGLATGIASSVFSITNFIAAKTHIYIEQWLHIHGAFYFYTAFTFVGLIYLYLFLIETEKRSHRQIEAEFSNDLPKIFADDCFANVIRKCVSTKPDRFSDANFAENTV